MPSTPFSTVKLAATLSHASFVFPNPAAKGFTSINLDNNAISASSVQIAFGLRLFFLCCHGGIVVKSIWRRKRKMAIFFINYDEYSKFYLKQLARNLSNKIPIISNPNYEQDRPSNCSKVDHVFVNTSSTIFKDIKVTSEPSALIYSDHKIINVFIELHQEDPFIVGKTAKWKTNTIIPYYEKQLINEILRTWTLQHKIDMNTNKLLN